jgi:hypothetical protein
MSLSAIRRPPFTIILTLAIASAACDDSVVEVGVIESAADPALIDVPSSVRRGEVALVHVRTLGTMCMSVEDTEVIISGEGAEITPYDRRQPGKCVYALVPLGHEAAVSFDSIGTKVILVNGRRAGNGDGYELVQKSFDIMVIE